MGISVNAYSKASVAAHVLADLLASERDEQKLRRSSGEIFQFIEDQGIKVTPFPYSARFANRNGLSFSSALNGLNKGFCFGPPPMVFYISDLYEASRKLVGLHEYFHLLNPHCRSTGNTAIDIFQRLAPGPPLPNVSNKAHDIEGPCNLFARCTLMPDPVFSETLAEHLIWNAAIMYDLPMAEIALRVTHIFPNNFAAVAYHYKRGGQLVCFQRRQRR